MKNHLLVAIAAASLLLSAPVSYAAEETKSSPATTELNGLVGKIQQKLRQGKNTKQDLDEELKAFSDLREKYKTDKSDEVAQIAFMQATLYLQVFQEFDTGSKMLEQLKQDFPETKAAQRVDGLLAQLEKQAEATKIQASLKEGAKFPGFEEKDFLGKPLSIANYKGKVVLIDFWATWCGPCVAELPNVKEAYEKHHDKGFEIIGISLDQDEGALKRFIKDKDMPWQQYFDGKGWGSKLAGKYGVNSIPMTYLLDGQGTIIGKNLRGPALEVAVAQALAKK